MFDVDFKIVCVFVFSGIFFVSSFVMFWMFVDFRIVVGCVVFGLVVIGLVMMEVIDDFKIICKKIFKLRIDVFLKEKIYIVL